MKIVHLVLLFGLLGSGCASARIDASTMPPGEFQSSDTDEAALYEAGLAFGNVGYAPSTPQGWAKVYADVEYVSGAYNTHARWLGIDGAAQAQIMIARHEVRRYLGIPEQAKSQDVLNALLRVSKATDSATMQTVLGDPLFTLGPAATLQRLQTMPHFFSTPPALAHLNKARYRQYGECSRLFC
jgi:hypothetical protein